MRHIQRTGILAACLLGLALPLAGRAATSATGNKSLDPQEAAAAVPGRLHTRGVSIVDGRGRQVRIAAVNWYGAEGTDFVPGGLDRRPYMSILRTIKSLGFNAVRLPFSNALVEENPVVRGHLKANRSLRGRRALSIMDAIIAGARRIGLMVILDDHRSNPGWTAQENGLWYTLPHYTPSGWIRDWAVLARRYRHNPAVVGFDLRNEPHTNGPGIEIVGRGYVHQGAMWGPFMGVEDRTRDWRLAAEQAGDAVLAIDPHILIIVEGTEVYPYASNRAVCPGNAPRTSGYCPNLYWWGGNLMGARAYPIVLNRPHQLVYSPHEYGPQMHGQRWIGSTMSRGVWQAEMTAHWGYLLHARGSNAAPVLIGEFGTPNIGESALSGGGGNLQGGWFEALMGYLHEHPSVGWAYWALNGTTSSRPGDAYGGFDSFGILTRDWAQPVHTPLLRTLHQVGPR